MRSKQRNQIAIRPLNTIVDVDCHEWAANQKRQTLMIVTLRCQRPGIFLAYDKSIPQAAICFQWRGSMIDAVLNVAVFAALVLCIVGFGAWAHKRVP